MIITRTPFRISFVGGGSDMEEYYEQSPGAVLSTTIDKYMYIASHRYFDDDQIRVKYAKTETVTKRDQLEHPIFREVLARFQISGALEISSNADIPAGSGLGSSSSFTVGLLHNLYARSGKYVSKGQLAQEACEVEIEKLKEPIGKQDQYAAAFGSLNVYHFVPNGAVTVEPVLLKADVCTALESNLLMFYTGRQRFASQILAEQKANTKSAAVRDVLKRMVDSVWEAQAAVYEGKLERFGTILDKTWRLKQTLASNVTNSEINGLYETGLNNGAIGGKLLGAGGSGFLLFYCDKSRQQQLRTALSHLRELKFRFDTEGSKVIYFGDEHPVGEAAI
jgi:D-glycero-alpha-D-manno-heptose-7-phosphate kinase